MTELTEDQQFWLGLAIVLIACTLAYTMGFIYEEIRFKKAKRLYQQGKVEEAEKIYPLIRRSFNEINDE